MKETYSLALKSSFNRKFKGRQRRDRTACLRPLHSGDKVLVRGLSERGGTNKMKSYWEEDVYRSKELRRSCLHCKVDKHNQTRSEYFNEIYCYLVNLCFKNLKIFN